MSDTVRFSVSLSGDLLKQFDRTWHAEGIPTRSEAVKTLIRQNLVQKEWESDDVVAGAIVLVYDHHEYSMSSKLVSVQHDFDTIIVATTHAHLDHDNCLECIIVDGKAEWVTELVKRLKAIKGIKHTELMMTTTGRNID